MKYIKQFENIQNKPDIGDYVVVKIDEDRRIYIPDYIIEYIENNIGKFVKYNYLYKDGIYVKYENLPVNNKNIIIFLHEVIFVSKDKNFAQSYLDSKKYNL